MNVNNNTYFKSKMTIGSGIPNSYSIANRTDSNSSNLTKGSDTVVHGIGDRFSINNRMDHRKRHIY